MVEFRVVCSDPETGESFQVEVSGHHANSLVGKTVGDEVDGMFVDLPGYRLEVTGGTDEDGIPMRPEIPSIGRKKVMVSDSTGFKPTRSGQRRKKSFRGNTISPEITQVNMKVVEQGDKPIDELLASGGESSGEAAGDEGGGSEEAEEPEEAADEGS